MTDTKFLEEVARLVKKGHAETTEYAEGVGLDDSNVDSGDIHNVFGDIETLCKQFVEELKPKPCPICERRMRTDRRNAVVRINRFLGDNSIHPPKQA